MAEPTPQKIRQAIEEFVQKYKPQELRVEINAHQKAADLAAKVDANIEPKKEARAGAAARATQAKYPPACWLAWCTAAMSGSHDGGARWRRCRADT